MILIKTKELQVCFMDVCIAFLTDRVCLVCVCMLVSVLQVLACAVRCVSSELSRCFLCFGSQMFPSQEHIHTPSGSFLADDGVFLPCDNGLDFRHHKLIM